MVPSRQPSSQPSSCPTSFPTAQPSLRPSSQPTKAPSRQPSTQPSACPTSQPSVTPTTQPTHQPTSAPTGFPSSQPTTRPSSQPSSHPSTQPSRQPSSFPSTQPSLRPTSQPSSQPTTQPSSFPTNQPTTIPSSQPTGTPTTQPTLIPSSQPSSQPTLLPTAQPSVIPSSQPTRQPSTFPSAQPSAQPSSQPTGFPSSQPSSVPSSQPSLTPSRPPLPFPTSHPSTQPSSFPTNYPTTQPTAQPTAIPSTQPSSDPTSQPTLVPSTQPTSLPTSQPSSQPTLMPSRQPTSLPSTQPSSLPTTQPSSQPTSQPSLNPSTQPSSFPSSQPSEQPTSVPSSQPTSLPSSQPSGSPSSQPTSQPTVQPSTQPTGLPTKQPSSQPSMQPTVQPSRCPSSQPSRLPSTQPSAAPTDQPTSQPSANPTRQPSSVPSVQPSSLPTTQPTIHPTTQPSNQPTSVPSTQPTSQPTGSPTVQPSSQPSSAPSSQPSSRPSTVPSGQPSQHPTCQPSSSPTTQPSAQPTAVPSSQPSSVPSSVPTDQPTSQPSSSPTTQPSSSPSGQPSSQPTTRPSRQPTQRPSSQPTSQPTRQPSCQPSSLPSSLPTSQPSSLPSTQPSVQPTGLPSGQPSSVPSSRPTGQPSRRPSSQPSRQPTTQPSVQPTSQPSSLRHEYVNITGIVLISRATTETVIKVQVAEKLLSNLFCYPIPQPSDRQQPPVLPKSTNEVITKGKETTIYFINNLVSLTGLSPVTNYTVYCLTVSLEGDIMPYKFVLQNALHFTTTCCKTIDVSISKSVVSVSSTVQNAVSLGLSNPPSTFLQLSCSLVSMTNPAVSISFFPAVTTFSGISTSLVQAYTFSIPTAGRYMLEVKAFGTSASEFQVNYLTSRYMNASLPTNLPPPALVSAMFNDDGTLVTVSFDQATNRGGYTNLFPCSALLSFAGVSQSQCRWQDDQNIAISQQSNSINGNSNVLLSTGDSIALVKNNTVTAKCNLQFGGGCPILICLPRTVFIATALNPVQPKVIIHAPSSISSCASLTLDISNSVGSGGRKWKSYKIEIFNSNSYDNDALSNFINNNRTYSLLPASAIPSLLLRKGSVYSFTITLCNFLGTCGKNSIEVAVSNSTYSLSLNILGNTQISIYPKDSLLIQAVGFVQTCGTSIPLTNDGKTDYKWTLAYVNGTVLPMTTISQNKLYFKLNPYSLHPATNYMITLTVRIAQFSLSQTSSASVQVQTDNVVASVVPSTFTSKPQQYILLDGTYSTDLNYPRDSSEQFGIRFQWGCLQVLPVFNASFCSFKFSQSNVLGKNQKLTYSALNATAGREAINSTVRIYLTVSKSGKSNTNYADIKIVSFVPKKNDVSVSVVSGSSSNFNTQVGLVLMGQIKVVSPCNSVWSVDDSSIALKNISLTPVSVTMNSLGVQSIYLSLRPNSLPGGSSLTFSLNCAGLAQLSISTNSPPLPGTFSVSPLTGQSLSTSFKFQALFWSDADLPLSYQFNYYSSRISSNVIIRGQNPSTTSSSILPEGSALLNHQIQCLLQVFDSLKAQSVRTANLTVVPSTNSSITSSFLNILRSQSSGQDASTDNSRVAVSIVATSLTKVNCSNLPFSCTALRRNPCSSLSQTCGDCLNGFIGDSQANSLCLTVSEYYILQGQSPTLSPTLLPSSLLHLQESNQISSTKAASLAVAAVGVNQRCSSNSQCPLWYSCDKVRRRCLLASKECTLNCLGDGNCTFQNINNADPLEKCFVNDPTCISTCHCDSGFTGAFCQYRTADWLTRQQTASLAMEVLFNLTRTDDINDQTLSSWTQLLQLLSSSPQLLDQPGMKMGIEVAVKAFQVANNRSLTTSAMSSSLIIALDNLATVLEITSYQLERFHNSSSIVLSSVNNSFVNSFGLISILDQFVLFKLGGIFLAEKDQSELFNQFRYLLAARKFITALGLSSSITLVVPQTDFELISNLGKTTVEIISRNDSESSIQEQAFTISVVEIRASNYQNKVHLVANPLKLLMQPINSIFVNQSMDYLSKFIDSVQFSIPFIKTMERYSDEFIVKNFSSFCAGENDRSVYNYFCEDSGTTIHHNCTGKRGMFVSHCPQPIPVCSSVIRNEFGFESFLPLNNCRLLNYSADFVQCKCLFSERIAINESLFFNRRLDSSNNSSEISYFHRNLYNLKEQSELAVTTTYIPYKYADTFTDETTEPVVWSGWVFLLIYFPTFALLSSLSYWYYSIRMVIKRRKKNPKKKVVPSAKSEKLMMSGERNKVLSAKDDQLEPHQFDQSAYQDQKLVHPFNPNLLATSEECAEEYLSFVNSVFPVLYQDCSHDTLDRSNWKSYFAERIQRVWVEITSHHNYLQFLFVDKIKIKNDLSQLFPNFRKIQRLLMCQLFILFLLVALFNIQVSDDQNVNGLDSCSSFSGQKDCESVKSALDSSTSHCVWQLKETSPTILRPTTLDPLVFDYECVSNDTFSLINPFVMMIVIIISIVASHFLGGWMDYFLEQFDSRLVPKPFFNLILNQQQQSNKSNSVKRVFPDSPLSREENMIKAEVVEEGEEQWEKNVQERREEVVVSPHSSPSFLKRITSSNQILPAEISPVSKQSSQLRDSQYRIIPHYSSLIRKKFKNESFKLRLQEMILQSEIIASNDKHMSMNDNNDTEVANNSLSSGGIAELMDFRMKLDSVFSVYSKLSAFQDSSDYEEAEDVGEEREKGETPVENELKQEEIQDFLDLFDSEWKFVEQNTLQEESQEQFRKEYEKIQNEVPNETKDLLIQSLNIMPEEHQAIELMYLHIHDQIASANLSLFASSKEQGKQSIPSKLFEMKFNDYFRLTSLSSVWPTVYLKLGVLVLGVLFVFFLVYSILLLLSHGSQFQQKVLLSFAIAIGVDLFILETSRCFLIYYYFPALEYQTLHSVYQKLKEQSMETMENLFSPRLPGDELERNPHQAKDEKDTLVSLSTFIKSLNGNNNWNKIPFNSNQFFNSLHRFVFQYYFNRTEPNCEDDCPLPVLNDDYDGNRSELNPRSLLIENILILSNQDIFPSKSLHKKIHPTEFLSLPPYIIPYSTLKDNIPQRKSSRSNVVVPDLTTSRSPQKQMNTKKNHVSHFRLYDDGEEGDEEEDLELEAAVYQQNTTTHSPSNKSNRHTNNNPQDPIAPIQDGNLFLEESSFLKFHLLFCLSKMILVIIYCRDCIIQFFINYSSTRYYHLLIDCVVLLFFVALTLLIYYQSVTKGIVSEILLVLLLGIVSIILLILQLGTYFFNKIQQSQRKQEFQKKKLFLGGLKSAKEKEELLSLSALKNDDLQLIQMIYHNLPEFDWFLARKKEEEEEREREKQREQELERQRQREIEMERERMEKEEEEKRRELAAANEREMIRYEDIYEEKNDFAPLPLDEEESEEKEVEELQEEKKADDEKEAKEITYSEETQGPFQKKQIPLEFTAAIDEILSHLESLIEKTTARKALEIIAEEVAETTTQRVLSRLGDRVAWKEGKEKKVKNSILKRNRYHDFEDEDYEFVSSDEQNAVKKGIIEAFVTDEPTPKPKQIAHGTTRISTKEDDEDELPLYSEEIGQQNDGDGEGKTFHSVPSFVPVFQEQESGKRLFSRGSPETTPRKAKEEMKEEQYAKQATTRSDNKKKIQQDAGSSSKLWKAIAATPGLTTPTKESINSKETGSFFSRLHLSLAEGSSKFSQKNLMAVPTTENDEEKEFYSPKPSTARSMKLLSMEKLLSEKSMVTDNKQSNNDNNNNPVAADDIREPEENQEIKEMEVLLIQPESGDDYDHDEEEDNHNKNKSNNEQLDSPRSPSPSNKRTPTTSTKDVMIKRKHQIRKKRKHKLVEHFTQNVKSLLNENREIFTQNQQIRVSSPVFQTRNSPSSRFFFQSQDEEENETDI
jgi:hypothetical protein